MVNTFIALLSLAVSIFLVFLVLKLSRQLKQSELFVEKLVKNVNSQVFNQIENYLSLKERLQLNKGLPYANNWSAAPDFLKLIVEHCLLNKPETIVECSSGLTTLMLARSCQINGTGHVYSMENGEEYVANIHRELRRYNLDNAATVLHSPLVKMQIKSEKFQWYELQSLPDLKINMLVIDGPPGYLQKNSRYPAIPALLDRLADGCTIFLDDAARPDEKKIVARWLDEHPEFRHEYIKTERGCSVIHVNKSE